MAEAAHKATVTAVHHYTDSLFKFRTTRPKSLRFDSGQFIMLGLIIDDKPVMRAYSMANPSWDDEFEFFSIKVQDGLLTSKLQHIKVDDEILFSAKAVGNLTLKSLRPGKRLFLLSTGTGIAPFGSIIRDPETYKTFDSAYLTHTCRMVNELQYGYDLMKNVESDPLCSEFFPKLKHYATTTRELHERQGRITDLIKNGTFFKDLEISPFNPEHDRVMLCGSMPFNKDMKKILEKDGFVEGAAREAGDYVLERAFVG